MSWLVAYALALPGFAGLCLSLPKHQKAVFGKAVSSERSKVYRWLGSGLITTAAFWCMIVYRWDFGLIAMCGVATAAALTVVITLALRPGAVGFLCWLPQRL